MHVVLVGPPGAGKGTQAQLIAARLQIPHVSTGDIFRENVSEMTELGQQAKTFMNAGDLVPDEITVAMVRDRLAKPDAHAGFILDGFPRTLVQAEQLQKTLAELDENLDVVLEMKPDDEELIRRLSGRRTCQGCGRIWHVVYDPTLVENRCDECGSGLSQRDDDQPETIRRRLQVYREQTEPLVGFYADLGLLAVIDAVGTVDQVTLRAVQALREALSA
ncbi:MAG: adenylate kinase [Actinomycetota bacterium]|nr:adenylate kinase [Actinomycetota bacterium]